MGLLDKLFGTTDAVKGLIEAGADTVDRFVFTKQDKLDYDKYKLEQEYREQVFEAEQKQKELDLHLAYYQTDAADRANARELNKSELAQDDAFIRRFRYIMAGVILLFCFVYIILITFMEIPKQNERFADGIMGGVIISTITLILTYFFGSSHGSSVKDDTIKKLS